MSRHESRWSQLWLGIGVGLLVGCTEAGGEPGGTGEEPGAEANGGGGTPAGGPTPADITEPTLVARLAAAYCDGIADCCGTASLVVDRGACADEVARTLADQLTPIGAVRFDAEAARDCEDALRSLGTCAALDDEVEVGCSRIYVGDVEPGQPCIEDAECAQTSGAAYCESTDGGSSACTVWAAAAADRAALGEPCAATCTESGDARMCSSSIGGSGPAPDAGDCYTNDGLYCSPTYECAPLGELGSTCRSRVECVAEATCRDGKCAPRAELGAACGPYTDACVAGLYCTSDATCAPRKAAGEACLDYDECQEGLDCDADGSSVPGTCRDYSQLIPGPGLCGPSFGLEE